MIIVSGIPFGSRYLSKCNLNKYRADAHCPSGQLYKDYKAVLDQLLLQVGGKILWRTVVLGQVVGNQEVDAALGVWYPSHHLAEANGDTRSR